MTPDFSKINIACSMPVEFFYSLFDGMDFVGYSVYVFSNEKAHV
jgi:hypothetical protein